MEPSAQPPRSPDRPILVLLGRESVQRGFLQQLAGESVWSDHPLAHDATAAGLPFRPHDLRDRIWTPIYDGPGLLAGGVERIRASRGDSGGHLVTYQDGESFVVSADGGTIRRLVREPGQSAGVDISRALGAPLALAFALRGLYLLHASGIAGRDGSVLAITADSGGGKSTLAAAAAAAPALGFTRVADDQLPVRFGASSAALPHFPQLKLQSDEQYPAAALPRVAFRALVELAVDPACTAPELARYEPRDALTSLVRATVAARLFDRELLSRHFDACAAAAVALPVYRLRAPRDLTRLAETLATLSRLPV